MSRPQILILTGPPGSGKTTVARLLVERNQRAAHLESDRFFHFIRTGYVETWKPESHEQNATVMQIVAEAAAGYASAGYFTIVDGIIIPGWFFETLRDALKAKGFAVAFAVLRPRLSTAVARVRRRSESGLADPEVVEQLWDSLNNLGALERHVTDSDNLDAVETTDLLIEHLRLGLLDT